jgi:hypothetical protein
MAGKSGFGEGPGVKIIFLAAMIFPIAQKNHARESEREKEEKS